MGHCIKIAKLTKCYGATVAVGGLSLDIEAGEVFGLLGPNGAGKSTTLVDSLGAGTAYERLDKRFRKRSSQRLHGHRIAHGRAYGAAQFLRLPVRPAKPPLVGKGWHAGR